MKRILTLSLCALAMGASAWASVDPYFLQTTDGTRFAGVSPDGKYIYGYGRNSETGTYDVQTSMLYDVATKEQSYITDGGDENMDKRGWVLGMTNSGICYGALKDKDWVAPYAVNSLSETVENEPLFTACLWKDGQLIKLDHGDYEDCSKFVSSDASAANPYPKVSNGFFVTGCSDDAKTVYGYMLFNIYYYPMRWDLDEATGKYVSTRYTVPATLCSYTASSRDNKVIAYSTKGDRSTGTSYLYLDGATKGAVKFEPVSEGDVIIEPTVKGVSPSGNYLLFECMRNENFAYGVYGMADQKVYWIPNPYGHSLGRWFDMKTVTDQGTGYMTDAHYALYYFDAPRGINIPMSDFINSYGNALTISGTYPSGSVLAVSDDGCTLAGNTLEAQLYKNGWALRLPEGGPQVVTLAGFKAYLSNPHTLTVKWLAPANLAEGVSVEKYMLNLDGNEIEVTLPTKGEDGYFSYSQAVTGTGAFTASAQVYAVLKNTAGDTFNSVPMSASVTGNSVTDLFFFEDNDDATFIDSMGYAYSHDTFTPVPIEDSDNLPFKMDTQNFNNNTPFWFTGSISANDWNTYLESRWFDASEKTGFYLTYMVYYQMINSYLPTESQLFSVEYTLDGENWEVLHTDNGLQNGMKWQINTIPLDNLEGRMFKLRFHASGPGNQHGAWGLDYYGIVSNDKKVAAPEDLIVVHTSKDATIYWKNGLGAYELSHNYNSPMTHNSDVGNEGKPLIVANDYDGQKLAPFAGKYITSVATMVYEMNEEQSYHTTVEAVVYEMNGAKTTEVGRGKLDPAKAVWYDYTVDPLLPIHHIYLDKGVKIEEGKRYRVGIRISEYEPATYPLWYFSASDDYVPGVTDLYSEDDGKTWQLYSDAFAEADEDEFQRYGRVIFNVRPCITDEAAPEHGDYNQKAWFYQAYKDGELLFPNIAYFSQQSIKDENPSDGKASYTVRVFHRDGACSDPSVAAETDRTGVEEISAEELQEVMTVADGVVTVAGEYDNAYLYAPTGALLLHRTSGSIDVKAFEGKLFFLVVEKEGRKYSQKLMK